MTKLIVFLLALGPAILAWLFAFAWLFDHTGWPKIVCAVIPAGAIVWIFSEAFK